MWLIAIMGKPATLREIYAIYKLPTTGLTVWDKDSYIASESRTGAQMSLKKRVSLSWEDRPLQVDVIRIEKS
jgi:hypothetical protein